MFSTMMGLCWLSLLAVLMLCATVHAKPVRIVDGVDRLSTDSISTYTGSMAGSDALPYMPPDALSGPSSLHFLNGHCFSSIYDRWEYSVCPFQNITQRRVLGGKTNLLGVFGHWRFDDSSPSLSLSIDTANANASQTGQVPQRRLVFSKMIFEDGKSCAEDGDASAGPFVSSTLDLLCDHESPEVKVLSVSDAKFCAFSFELALPIPCHLLSLDDGDVRHQEEMQRELKREL